MQDITQIQTKVWVHGLLYEITVASRSAARAASEVRRAVAGLAAEWSSSE